MRWQMVRQQRIPSAGVVEDADGARPDTFPTTLTITLNGADEHTSFMAGVTGARAAAVINGIEFRAQENGVEANSWLVSFGSGGGDRGLRFGRDFEYAFSNTESTPDMLDLNGLVFTAVIGGADSGLTVRIIISGSDDTVSLGLTSQKHLAITAGSAATFQDVIDAVADDETISALFKVTTDSPTTTVSVTAQTSLAGGTGAPSDPANFAQAKIVTGWNADTSASGVVNFIKATLLEDGTYEHLDDWPDDVALTGGGNTADLSVTEQSDTDARGYIQVIAPAGTVTYGATDDTGPDGNTVTVTGTGDARMAVYQGTFGRLTVDGDGDWVYELGGGISDLNAALNAAELAAGDIATSDGDGSFDSGETLTESFIVTVSDGTTSHDVPITITVNGANDPVTSPNAAPTLMVTSNAADLAGAVTEDASPNTATGSLTFTDTDDLRASLSISAGGASSAAKTDTAADHDQPADLAADAALAALTFTDVGGTLTATVAGTYGTFTLTRDDSTGALGWTYALDNSDAVVQGLTAGQTAYEKLAVRVADDDDATSATQYITVTITGANDAPVLDVDGARQASLLFHGVRFTANEGGTDGNRFRIDIQSSTGKISIC